MYAASIFISIVYLAIALKFDDSQPRFYRNESVDSLYRIRVSKRRVEEGAEKMADIRQILDIKTTRKAGVRNYRSRLISRVTDDFVLR